MSESAPQKYLGDYVFTKKSFEGIDNLFSHFTSDEFKSFPAHKQKEEVNTSLYSLIKSHEKRQFLFLETLDYIEKVRNNHIIDRYNLIDFELWLNQFSEISYEENYHIRGLVCGKYIPRNDYQVIFPIGMGKTHEGSHIVTAHSSPDLDTIVASFWGWMDAFSAKVSEGLHIWNVPGGPPASHVEVEMYFYNIFGKEIFHYLSKNRSQLSLTSFDLMTQEGFVVKNRYDQSLNTGAERSQVGVVIVDDEGYYLGDWRSFDVESIRHVIMSFNACLRWMESNLNRKLITLFSHEKLRKDDIEQFKTEAYHTPLKSSEPYKEFTERQITLLDSYLKRVLGVKEGASATFLEFTKALQHLQIADFALFEKSIDELFGSGLFSQEGEFIENRPLLFFHLEKIIKELNDVFRAFRLYVDTLDIAYKVKTDVFGYSPQYLSHRTDVEEIMTKIGSYPYLTVNVPGPDDKQIPVGIIKANALKKKILGTVTLRDFCNRDETKVPPYFEVISVIDHHKSSIATITAPTATLTDAQSANAVVAQFAFQMHDRYSLSSMSEDQINLQIQDLSSKASSMSDFRVLRRLYQKKEALARPEKYFVAPEREILEYMQYIFAILDDTDLLTKVSYRDVMIMKDLLNRLKTLTTQKETEVVHFDDIDPGENFVEEAAKKLLQNQDLYSLYSKVYKRKEMQVEENLKLCSQGQESNIFVDTKIQNGCARVGQTKIFAKNYPFFNERKLEVRNLWFQESEKIFEENNDIDLHLHMVSTIASAEELFKGEKDSYLHKDQMWVWIPETELSIEHLKYFLSVFKSAPRILNNDIRLEFYGPRAKELSVIFKESFLNCQHGFSDEKLEESYAVIYYNAGSINSRKALVSPYLPKLGN